MTRSALIMKSLRNAVARSSHNRGSLRLLSLIVVTLSALGMMSCFSALPLAPQCFDDINFNDPISKEKYINGEIELCCSEGSMCRDVYKDHFNLTSALESIVTCVDNTSCDYSCSESVCLCYEDGECASGEKCLLEQDQEICLSLGASFDSRREFCTVCSPK